MIVTPVVYCEDDQTLVDAFNHLPRPNMDSNYWSSDELKDLRGRVKTFYITAQGSRCCYCNRHLGTENHRVWDVEHIADRSKHAWFMFTPTNLAAACLDCNTAKSSTEVLTNARRVTYPSGSQHFKIIHPHFNRFADHILRVGQVYLPKTSKGKFTIYKCDLLRFAEKYIEWENRAVDRRFETEVSTVFADGLMAQAAVENIIAQLPNAE
ncbi:hypothetical protein LU298_09770 [Komagataeibacter intermedius]|uniref:HNH endonuclease n=2 Tax=Komagataeibacter intermedius TaxID=66229 RepID=A0A0N1FAW7_9PROT|nr:hypothetical protein [Komagataeibacter intermedius]KPH86851.1 hypothetical protein GLUCOINTEAF2_0202485 [Komagataeibacter intermedius AF2]MCF3636780.1 hypothetical protein [Komagataeibacter intermedius]GAN88093.1 hypothetical protein Gain_0138_003 [Komagataeibacter intermedius TF2]GBQ71566.1 hypothetical protein AA0521_1934 [Komagataeibacter intermedius NRIC 0521]